MIILPALLSAHFWRLANRLTTFTMLRLAHGVIRFAEFSAWVDRMDAEGRWMLDD